MLIVRRFSKCSRGMCFSSAMPRFALSSSCCVNPTARDLAMGASHCQWTHISSSWISKLLAVSKYHHSEWWEGNRKLNSGTTAVDVSLDQALSLHQVTRPEAECHRSCGGILKAVTRRLAKASKFSFEVSFHIYIYTYIYICVCVCVCVYINMCMIL